MHMSMCINMYAHIYMHTYAFKCMYIYTCTIPTNLPGFVKIGQLVQSCWSHKTTLSKRNIIRIKVKGGFDSNLKWFFYWEVCLKSLGMALSFLVSVNLPVMHCACWIRDINITGFLMQNCLLWSVHNVENWRLSVWQCAGLLFE
jgi:hypothetical protein